MTSQTHWETVYTQKAAENVSWYQPHLEVSLDFIAKAGLASGDAIIDVGGGASTLVDDLLARGFTNLTVLDLSAKALETAQARLGERAALVRWLVGDVRTVALPQQGFAFWHDRAVFHFLRDQADRRAYVAQVRRALQPGGHVVVATFGPQGPEKCSGLEVARYDGDGLHAEFGAPFEKLSSCTEVHDTPWGSEQQFVYCFCRSVAG